MALFCSAAWLATAVWLIWRAFRQNRAFRHLPEAAVGSGRKLPGITVVVPARDEAENISGCLSALMSQNYPADQLRIVVVDDHSSDATATIVSAFARANDRLTLVRSPPLPAGWTGKAHACFVGSRAVSGEAEWLCFIDADVRASPLLLASAVMEATNLCLDFLSLTPRLELGSFAERLVMPCGLYLLAFYQDLIRIHASAEEAAASGKFILIRRASYEKLGGHAAVRTEVCEDVALARLAKRCGFRLAIAGGDRLLSTRMYTGWRSLWIGLSKNLADMLGGPIATAMIAVLGVAIAWTAVLLPPGELFGCVRTGGGCLALVLALLGSAAPAGAAPCGIRTFPHSGLVRPPIPARLHGGSDDCAR